MKAVSCREGRLDVVELPTPVPGPGQLLIDVLRCGICGSDLHARHHCDELAELAREAGYDDFMRSDQDVVMGHEFCGEVVERGPRTRGSLPEGTDVVAMPLLRARGGVHGIGLSAVAPGAYAEQILVQESLAIAVPNGLPPQLATLTEPMAVAWHAVRRGEVKKRTVAIVIGCGPIGLSVICMLKASGVRTVIASDFSPGRRALARACGADVVVDPALDSPYGSGEQHGHLTTLPAVLDTAVGAMEKLHRLPLPWHRVWRAAEALRRDHAEEPGDLRMRRGPRRDRPDHRQRTAVLARGRGRGLHGRRPLPPGDGDQQGDRPALRGRLHAAGVPRHAADAGRGQGRRLAAGHRLGRPGRGRGRLRSARGPRDPRQDPHRPQERGDAPRAGSLRRASPAGRRRAARAR